MLNQRDSEKTLDSSAVQYEQTAMEVEIVNSDHDGRAIDRVVFVGMGGLPWRLT